MKTLFSFILFLTFLSYSSQEITDKEAVKKCGKEFSKKICLSDEDKDSVLFYLDECPKIFGVAENNGCAWTDTDNDGIFDKDDACPDVSGPEENHGCPWPDTDGDGILDKDDACPIDFGYASDEPRKNGCKNGYKAYSQEELKTIEMDFLKDSEKIDFKLLADFIIPKIDVNIFQNDLILFKLFRLSVSDCGENFDTRPTLLREEIIYRMFWNEYTFKKLINQFPKKQFVPWCSYDCFTRMPFLKDINHSELIVNAKKDSPMYVFNLKNPKKYELDEVGYQTNCFTINITLKKDKLGIKIFYQNLKQGINIESKPYIYNYQNKIIKEVTLQEFDNEFLPYKY